MIRSRTFFNGSKGFVLFSEEYKKSEPFSYREKVWIFYLRGGSPLIRMIQRFQKGYRKRKTTALLKAVVSGSPLVRRS